MSSFQVVVLRDNVAGVGSGGGIGCDDWEILPSVHNTTNGTLKVFGYFDVFFHLITEDIVGLDSVPVTGSVAVSV